MRHAYWYAMFSQFISTGIFSQPIMESIQMHTLQMCPHNMLSKYKSEAILKFLLAFTKFSSRGAKLLQEAVWV